MMQFDTFNFIGDDALALQKPAQPDAGEASGYTSAPATGPAAFFATLRQLPATKASAEGEECAPVAQTPVATIEDVVKPQLQKCVPPGGIHIAKPATPVLSNTLSLTAPSRPKAERGQTLREARRRIAMEPPSGDREQPIDGFVYTIRPFIAGGGYIKSVMWSPSGRPITDQLPGPAHKPPRRGRIPAVPPGP